MVIKILKGVEETKIWSVPYDEVTIDDLFYMTASGIDIEYDHRNMRIIFIQKSLTIPPKNKKVDGGMIVIL